jgi:glycosyltransferase involved in cell wall biosynthesis
MHIAFFTTSLPEPNRKPGGVDVYVQRLADRLVARGHILDLYSFSPPVDGALYRHIQLSPPGFRYRKLARMSMVPLLLNRVRPDAEVFHLHGDDWFYTRRSLPTVRTFYGSALGEAKSAERLRRRVNSYVTFALEVVAARLATSAYDIAPGTGRGFSTAGTLPPAIDVVSDDGPRALQPTILFVGTWGGRKRGRMLADVFTRDVRPVVPNARLVMVSDHVELGPGIEHVPRPTDREVAALMRAAWIMCLPSRYEGFGIPYIEAMAAGTPVVSTPNPGARYVLDEGRAGIISNDEELGPTLVRALLDAGLRAEYGKRGRLRVREFAWERVLHLHERAYADACLAWARLRNS